MLHRREDRLQITFVTKCYMLVLPLRNGVRIRAGILPPPLTDTVSLHCLSHLDYIQTRLQTQQRINEKPLPKCCVCTCGPTTPPGPGGPVFPWKPLRGTETRLITG